MSEGVEAHFAVVGADAGVLHAAEAHGVTARVNDHIVDGGPAAAHRIQDVPLERTALREDIAGQRMFDRPHNVQRLVHVAPGDDGQRRTEDLLAHERIIDAHARHHGRLNLQRLRIAPAAEGDAGALGAVVNEPAHHVEVLLVDHVRVVGAGQHVLAVVLVNPPLQFFHELVGHILVHKRVVGPHAGLTRVQAFAPGDALGGAADVGVRGDEHGAFAAELQGDARQVLGRGRHDLAPHTRAAGEHDFVEFHLQEPVVHLV